MFDTLLSFSGARVTIVTVSPATSIQEGKIMKKIISIFLALSSLTLFVPGFAITNVSAMEPVTAAAATSGLDAFENFFAFDPAFAEAAACPRGTFRVRKHTRTKKKVIHSAIAGGAGAIVGGLIGGGRGALIGAGAGAGGYLTYRYVKDRRGRCVRVRAY